MPGKSLQYTHLSFQMMAMIGVGAWLGMRLDTYFRVPFPVFLSMLAPASTVYAVYVAIKTLTQHLSKNS